MFVTTSECSVKYTFALNSYCTGRYFKDFDRPMNSERKKIHLVITVFSDVNQQGNCIFRLLCLECF